MSERKRCEVEDNQVWPCDALNRTMEGTANDKRKGVTMMVLVDLTSGLVTRTAAVLRSGDYRHRGVIINFCPFCGANISEHFEEHGDG